MSDVLLATSAHLPEGDEDAALLLAALAERGVTGRWAVWTDPAVDWSAALVVLRSTWDYAGRRAQFLAWTRGVPRLANAADVVAWNTDKTYLADLRAAGVPIVPSAFAAPGEPVPLPGEGEFVVKPAVGAGSRGAGRFRAARADDAREHAAALHAAGRTVLVQPYLSAVDTEGETALIFVDGAFSHAVRKAALLAADTAHAVDGTNLYLPESMSPAVADDAQRAVAEQALAAVRTRFAGEPLYARVDLLPSPDGPVVIELELTEPSLFLSYPGPEAAARFAAAIAARA